MIIYADENIEAAIIDGLRRRAIRVLSAGELGYRGKSDMFHLKKAYESSAVILTHDADFLMIAGSPGTKHRGIIFARSGKVSVGACIRGVELIAKALTERDMENSIEFL